MSTIASLFLIGAMFGAIPAEDEPQKLIRYLRQENAVLRKERDELETQILHLEQQISKILNDRMTPHAPMPDTDRMTIPVYFRYGLPVRGQPPFDDAKWNPLELRRRIESSSEPK